MYTYYILSYLLYYFFLILLNHPYPYILKKKSENIWRWDILSQNPQKFCKGRISHVGQLYTEVKNVRPETQCRSFKFKLSQRYYLICSEQGCAPGLDPIRSHGVQTIVQNPPSKKNMIYFCLSIFIDKKYFWIEKNTTYHYSWCYICHMFGLSPRILLKIRKSRSWLYI